MRRHEAGNNNRNNTWPIPGLQIDNTGIQALRCCGSFVPSGTGILGMDYLAKK